MATKRQTEIAFTHATLPTEPEQEEPSDTAGEEERSSDDGDVPQQLALLEVWMGLPGHCTDREKCSLRAALALRDSVSTTRCGEANEKGGEDQSNPMSVPSTLEVKPNVWQVAVEVFVTVPRDLVSKAARCFALAPHEVFRWTPSTTNTPSGSNGIFTLCGNCQSRKI